MTPVDPDFDLLQSGEEVYYRDGYMCGYATILARSNKQIHGSVAYIVKTKSMHPHNTMFPATFDEYMVLIAKNMFKYECET